MVNYTVVHDHALKTISVKFVAFCHHTKRGGRCQFCRPRPTQTQRGLSPRKASNANNTYSQHQVQFLVFLSHRCFAALVHHRQREEKSHSVCRIADAAVFYPPSAQPTAIYSVHSSTQPPGLQAPPCCTSSQASRQQQRTLPREATTNSPAFIVRVSLRSAWRHEKKKKKDPDIFLKGKTQQPECSFSRCRRTQTAP